MLSESRKRRGNNTSFEPVQASQRRHRASRKQRQNANRHHDLALPLRPTMMTHFGRPIRWLDGLYVQIRTATVASRNLVWLTPPSLRVFLAHRSTTCSWQTTDQWSFLDDYSSLSREDPRRRGKATNFHTDITDKSSKYFTSMSWRSEDLQTLV